MVKADVMSVLMELTVQWGKQKNPQQLQHSEHIRGGRYENSAIEVRFSGGNSTEAGTYRTRGLS